MKRSIVEQIRTDLQRKVVFISGPRQVGKTTLAKMVHPSSYDYLNYDYADHRLVIKEKSWDRKKHVIILDEIHKMKNWKAWLKGIVDVESSPPHFLVTGSARLEVARKVGDSMAGRFLSHRLHPFDLKELKQKFPLDTLFTRLMNVGGFPEPFLLNDQREYRRWRRSHLDVILRQDLIDMFSVQDIQSIETLIALLRRRVGSTVSYAHLAQDLEKDASTIKRWLTHLENLYIIFRVTPYSRNVARSLLKEPKYYFYDIASVESGDGQKLENLVACALIKEIHFVEDVLGDSLALHFLRTKDGKEIDFLVAKNDSPLIMVEVKARDENISPHFFHFSKFLPVGQKIQLVLNPKREKTYPSGEEVRSLIPWLASIKLGE
jgi:predicted AAA+ superfamily ATPase